ncbi:MAG: ATP-binding protein [Nitrospiraceae bacterium]
MTTPAVEAALTAKQTQLQRVLTTALNDLNVDAALAAIFHRESGPLTAHGSKGLTPREVHTILRTLSSTLRTLAANSSQEQEGGVGARLKLVTPSSRNLLAVPLRYRQRTYGALVLGRRDQAPLQRKERALIENACEGITKTLEKEQLFDGSVIMTRPLVSLEPISAQRDALETLSSSPSYVTPEIQDQALAILSECAQVLPFDRAWVAHYDPLAGSVEVIAVAGESRSDGKRDLKAGLRLALEASASGWAVRHRKPRVDHDLASTQGRFADHKHLYKDRFLSAFVLPFFVRGQVGGTLTLAAKEATRYGPTDATAVEPIILKLVDLFQKPLNPATLPAAAESGSSEPTRVQPAESLEPAIRKQERQAAIGEFSAFLATELREPLASIRAQLEEVTGEGILDFDPQTRVEKAMRDLIRIEALLNEILDFAKPLELNRRLCRVPEIIENALAVVSTELEVTRIQVTKDYAAHLAPVRCDEAKMQQVLLSIFKNSIEAMSPGGQLHIGLSPHRAGRHQEVQVVIKNDGAPIPPEHLSKVFEPFFSTKRSGTGLGLASVKKIVEEHGGHISLASSEGQGTTTTIRLPAMVRRPPFRHRGRGRRNPRH